MESRGSKAESMRFAFAHCTSTLEQLRKVLPTYQSLTIVDIPPDFSQDDAESDEIRKH